MAVSSKNNSSEITPLVNNTNELEDKITPLPQPQFFILLIVRFSEPLAFGVIFPFIYYMVRDFGITKDDAEIGYYVGYIASVFAIAQACTSLFWGTLSDKIGRKPVIICGLLGSSLSLFLFGLSKSLLWAVLTRSISGVLNGNVGVVKTMVGELTDKTNRAKGFSYLPMMFGLGTVFGPAIGGALAKPTVNIPWLFAGNEFLTKYPYFLPCAFAGTVNILNAIFAYYYLEETLKSKRPDYNPSSESTVDTLAAKKKPSQKISKNSISVMFGLGIMALSAVMYGELFVLWAASDINVGGLNFEETDVATVMSSNGIAILVFQLLFYPTLQRRLGSLKLYRYVFPLYIAICIAIPMVNIIVRNSGYSFFMYISLYTLTLLRAACNTIGFTSINILLVETAEDTSNLGKLNGLSQTVGAICRSIAPTLCGTVFSYSLTHHLPYPFDYHFVWYILASLCFLNYLNSFRIKLNE
jgi:MFS family permease